MLGERVEPRLVADGKRDRLGPCVRRRHAFGDRSRRRTDEAAGSEHVERAGPFADEVRWGLEPGLPTDTAAGQERDAVLADVPAGRFRGVAGISVLGRENEERLFEPLVQRGEDERKRRLGHAGASGQGLDEGGQSRSLSASSRASGLRTGRSMTTDGTRVPRGHRTRAVGGSRVGRRTSLTHP